MTHRNLIAEITRTLGRQCCAVAIVLALLPAVGLATTADLIAGQHIDAGDVVVWNDSNTLYVKYVTADGWSLTETHLHVASSLGGIPQTKKGNPIPGKFDHNTEHAPAVTDYLYTIDLDSNTGDKLYIAAHAVVCREVEGDTAALYTATLWAGQHINSGNVTVAVDGENLVVTYGATGGWEILETHLYVGTLPPTTSAPGQFPYKHEGLGGAVTDTYIIPLSNLGVECGDTIYIAAHAALRKLTGNVGGNPIYQQETGWGWGGDGGIPFGNNWARYFSVTVICDPGGGTESECETAWGDGEGFRGKNWATYFTYIVGTSNSPEAPSLYSKKLSTTWGRLKGE